MNFKSDLYFFIPCTQTEQKRFRPAIDEEAQKFIYELEKTAGYEFDSVISHKVHRTLIGRIELVCKDDDRESPCFNGKQDAFLYVTSYKHANIHLLTIVVSDVEVQHTFLLDQASRNELIVISHGQEEKFTKWIQETYGFATLGKVYSASCLSEFMESAAPYILAAEAYHENQPIKIKSKDIDRMLKNNVAQYTFYDAYLSPSSLLFVMHEFPDDFSERLYNECLMVFIMELVVLQITAISYVNKMIINKLVDNKDISLLDILKLYELFAATMPLWDIRKFRYEIAQNLADKVSEAFKVNDLMSHYEKNRKMLEDLERIKSSISSEKESKILNAVATILAIIQILPLSYSISYFFFDGNMMNTNQFMSVLSTSALVLIPICILQLTRRSRRN